MIEVNKVPGLSPSDREHLRRPFTPEAVRFRIQGKPSPNKSIRVLTYIDSRLAAERLSEVDPNWTADYKFLAKTEADVLGREENLPVACVLTVNGVTRVGVGQNNDGAKDDKHVKSAFSDALKRSAVDFGVGAYLYTLGEQRVQPGEYWESNGKPGGINAKGQKRLRSEYAKIISSKAFEDRFGKPVDYGDSIVNSSEVVAEVPASSPDVQEDSVTDPIKQQDTVGDVPVSETIETLDPYVAAAADLAKATGRSAEAMVKWMQSKQNKNLAIKRAVKQAGERGADRSTVEKILKENGLEEHITAFVEGVKA